MADHAGENDSFVDSVMDKINDKLHGHDSSSDSEDDKGKKSPVDAVKTKIYRLFGREKPVHKVLGGGKRTLLKSLSIFILNTDTNMYVYLENVCDFDSFLYVFPHTLILIISLLSNSENEPRLNQ